MGHSLFGDENMAITWEMVFAFALICAIMSCLMYVVVTHEDVECFTDSCVEGIDE